MKLATLQAINQARQARKAVALITDMTSGDERLVAREGVAADPLAAALDIQMRQGKSGVVEYEGHRSFITVHMPPVRVVIIGAVHISQTLVPFVRLLGHEVIVVDPRTAFASSERFPDVTPIAEWPDTALPPLGVDCFTALVALTHDPKIDDPAIEHALARECFYIGALGSRKTHARRLERLRQAGCSDAATARIHAPVGLDIGAVSPAEIAVSIIAEITAALRLERSERAPRQT